MPESITTADGLTRDIATILPTSRYTQLMRAGGSHIAGRVAGTYGLPTDDPLVATGVGSLYPLSTVQLIAADFPSVNGIATKLRLRVQLYTNDVAPTGNYTFGLYPVTRPATSGGAGLCIFTLGTVVTGSTILFTTPAADSLLSGASTDFTFPADGHYAVGVVTTATVAVSALAHAAAQLQMRN